jgi:hypothetical protein
VKAADVVITMGCGCRRGDMHRPQRRRVHQGQ